MTTETETPAAEVELTVGEQITEIVNAEKVEESTAVAIRDSFQDFCVQAQEWAKKSESIKVTNITQVAEMKLARESRLALRRIRLDMETKRKELKEDSLRRGRALDAVGRFIKSKIEPLEEHLKEQEEFADRYLEAERQRKVAERDSQLREKTDTDPSMLNLGEMTDEQFATTLQQGIDARQARIDREKREEAERIAKEKAEAEERERIRKENERLKAEAAERERRIEAERIERERIEAEKQAKLLKEQEEARAKREAEEKARKEAESKAEAERQAKHRKVLSRQIAMREFDGETDYDVLAGLTDDAFDKCLVKTEANHKAHIAEQEAKRKAEEEAQAKRDAELEAERKHAEAERKERERIEAEAKAKQETDEARLKSDLQTAAKHAADIVVETAETWASRHPKTKDGAQRFVSAVILELNTARQSEED